LDEVDARHDLAAEAFEAVLLAALHDWHRHLGPAEALCCSVAE
jgi:hypothetical protein